LTSLLIVDLLSSRIRNRIEPQWPAARRTSPLRQTREIKWTGTQSGHVVHVVSLPTLHFDNSDAMELRIWLIVVVDTLTHWLLRLGHYRARRCCGSQLST